MKKRSPKGDIRGITQVGVTTLAGALLGALPVGALDQLEFPSNARAVVEEVERLGSYDVPKGPFQNGTVETIVVEGEVRRQAWQVLAPGATTLQILKPLRDQLKEAGFETVFSCEARKCGGFDFRYAISVLPAPMMHVDLGDYRFLAAKRGDADDAEYVVLMVSRTEERGFVQITRIGPETDGRSLVVTSTKSPLQPKPAVATRTVSDGSLIGDLEAKGRAVLDDLEFKTGSSALGDGSFASLETLGIYLKANPSRAIVLVGHTDAEGSLAGNIALSKKRATAVRSELIALSGIPSEQVKAEGVGFLAPLASNLTVEGRTANRRVEVILSVTE